MLNTLFSVLLAVLISFAGLSTNIASAEITPCPHLTKSAQVQLTANLSEEHPCCNKPDCNDCSKCKTSENCCEKSDCCKNSPCCADKKDDK